ncbi:hypothetical protein FGF1_16110 [Flavobacteriaceae bacterium GF1]
MGIILVFLGCSLLYAKSKHFPDYFANFKRRARENPKSLRLISYGMFLLSMVVLCLQNGVATGLVIFLITLMFGLSLTIMFLPLNKKYAYLMVGLSLLSIIVENSL